MGQPARGAARAAGPGRRRPGAAPRLRRHPRRAGRAGRVPSRGAGRGERGRGPPAAAGARRDGARVLHGRPGRVQGPRPGDVPRAHARPATASATPSRTCRSWVVAGGAIDRETRRRGQTIYAPDRSTPLHPETLSEDAASLLPGEARPAFVWDLRLDGDGQGLAAEVYRAMVRSVERMDYEGVQAAVDGGTDDERLLLLREVGERRIALERARGGANLPMPEQEVTMQDGRYLVGFRPPGAGRGLERPDLADDRDGRGRDDAARPGRHPAHHARARGRHGRPVPPAGPGARGRPGPRAPATASSCAPWTAPTRGTWR